MTDDHRALLLRAAVGFTLVSPDGRVTELPNLSNSFLCTY